MKSLVDLIKESILDNDETVITNTYMEANRAIAEKLAKKFDHAKNFVGKWSYDNLGHKLEEYDIIITINTTVSNIGIITQLQDPDDEECMMVYIPSKREEVSIYPFDVIKIENPKKYL